MSDKDVLAGLDNVVNGVWYGSPVTEAVVKCYAHNIPLLVMAGGSYAGKTANALVGILLLAQNNDLRIAVFCENFPLLKRDALHFWNQLLQTSGTEYDVQKTHHIYTIGGSTVEFRALDNEGTARGAKQDISYIVEVNLIDKARYDQIMMRTTKMMMCCFNPSERFWLVDQVIPKLESDKYVFKRFTYKDNPFTPPKVIETLEGYAESDLDLYNVYTLGLWGKTEGNVYRNPTIIEELPNDPSLTRCYGVDFGYSNDPSVLLDVRYDKSLRRIYVKELFYELGHTANDFASSVQGIIEKNAPVWCDSARPDSITTMQRYGIDARPVRKVKDSITIGIDHLRSYRWFVTGSSKNLIDEVRKYKYRLLPDGTYTKQPVDKYNHALDALRYTALMEIGTSFGKTRKLRSVSY